MATEKQVQELVHRIEEGRWAKWVQLGALLSVMVAMFGAFILDPWGWGLYKGLNHPKAMEQAQIARELARGNGFSSKMIRPMVYSFYKEKKGVFPAGNIPDVYHAPLWPATLAPFLQLAKIWPDSLIPFRPPAKDRWQLTTRDYVYMADRAISAVAMIFFFLSVLISYLIVRRLFDHLIAIWTVLLMLGCNLFWQYSLSGLPQMMMLFFFSCALYTLVRAMEIRVEQRWPWGWLVCVAFFFGLLTLTHGIGAWTFAGALFFSIFYFKPHLKTALLMSSIFLLVYSPWLYRTYKVSGNPFGVSGYCALEQIKGAENTIMRSQDIDLSGLSPSTYRRKIQVQATSQMGNLVTALGGVLVAPVFFLALLHLFKNSLPRKFRWALFSMWLFSSLGMGVFAMNDEGNPLASNDLNVLFIPMFTAFGMAFVLVLWTRLEINVKMALYGFYALIFGVCTLPLFNYILMSNKSPVQWPPYVPPYIAIMRDWTQPNEIIASDMPWAVAWYADRKSLWLPITIQNFLDLNDYQRLGGKIAGIYITPVSGNKSLIGEIVKGDYKDWAPFILRNVNIKDFPLKAVTAMPLDNQCIFYSDRDRWTDRLD